MKKTVKIATLAAVVTLAVTSMSGCGASWQRSVKSMGSDLNGGLNRTVTVYSYTGEKIAEYTGKFDIEENDAGTKVLFDKDGKRTIIYNAVVIAQED